MQRTIAKELQFSGVCLHDGGIVSVEVLPAGPNSGIIFKRTDVFNQSQEIEANFRNVSCTALCTTIANKDGTSVSTVEHLMSALWACEIDNALITINGPEIPIMDGSAAPFVKLISETGIVRQKAKRKTIKVTRAVEVSDNNQNVTLSVSDTLLVDFSIDFSHQAIGKQNYVFTECAQYTHSPAKFAQEIGYARTFGFADDLRKLKDAGFAKGASLENSIGLDDREVLNEGGLRSGDEFVRHKILDCLGDLYLAGTRIMCSVKASCSGHSLNNAILHELFKSAQNYEII